MLIGHIISLISSLASSITDTVYIIHGVSSLRSLSPCTCVEVFEWYG